ncbi:hypothetical protein H0H92_013293 [Tricholoma furcatifolium]|nr:hypothetical protein H0H92_013293 [Tricholoma furcatifolium]
MNDGTTDVLDDCVILPVPVSSADLTHFLKVMHEPPDIFPLATLEDFYALRSVLILATRFDAAILRRRTLATLQERYPATLGGWNRVRPPSTLQADPDNSNWEWDRALIINLARGVEAFSLLPAAMAMLTNDCSAGEVFGVRLPASTEPLSSSNHASPTSPFSPSPFSPNGDVAIPQRTPLNPTDNASFALLKEHHHITTVSLLRSIRALGTTCNRPPEILPSVTGRAPVGSLTLRPGASVCSATFKDISGRLLEELVLERPVGFASFVGTVLEVKQDKTKVCKYCWREFEGTVGKARERWWEALPAVLGFDGWGDERLELVEP